MSSFAARAKIYKSIEKERHSRVICIVTGDRPSWETQLSRDFCDILVDHLDFGDVKKISLILHTNGGDTLAAWRLVHLIRQFCEEFEVLIPLKALSAGTLICLGADNIMMTKQASLGPIDPSVNGPLNPLIPGASPPARAPVSVEAIKGYLEIARAELGIKDDVALASVFTTLSNQIHPIVLGQVFRARSQIQALARKLLKHQVKDSDKVDAIISFLCSESGSHDYTIDRNEARDLGLQVEKPSKELYELLRRVHMSYRQELRISEPWDPAAALANEVSINYDFTRCLVESMAGGCHGFVSRGTLTKQQQGTAHPAPVAIPGLPFMMAPQVAPGPFTDQRDFEGWKKLK